MSQASSGSREVPPAIVEFVDPSSSETEGILVELPLNPQDELDRFRSLFGDLFQDDFQKKKDLGFLLFFLIVYVLLFLLSLLRMSKRKFGKPFSSLRLFLPPLWLVLMQILTFSFRIHTTLHKGFERYERHHLVGELIMGVLSIVILILTCMGLTSRSWKCLVRWIKLVETSSSSKGHLHHLHNDSLSKEGKMEEEEEGRKAKAWISLLQTIVVLLCIGAMMMSLTILGFQTVIEDGGRAVDSLIKLNQLSSHLLVATSTLLFLFDLLILVKLCKASSEPGWSKKMEKKEKPWRSKPGSAVTAKVELRSPGWLARYLILTIGGLVLTRSIYRVVQVCQSGSAKDWTNKNVGFYLFVHMPDLICLCIILLSDWSTLFPPGDGGRGGKGGGVAVESLGDEEGKEKDLEMGEDGSIVFLSLPERGEKNVSVQVLAKNQGRGWEMSRSIEKEELSEDEEEESGRFQRRTLK
ncbi:hypothetical protein IE53DRAFT_386133 [Violaceomyces palustris]|uniref:Uncharacterized protein n=1 Tax=Violaceomyces palustris TaxID=1673888 RepID=A0ACD0P0B0_9BASI|nr:hypothetical protein IE53DRAFT_386133 [Violaceomyces palustris]